MSANESDGWKALARLLLAAWESEDPRDHHDDCDITRGEEECCCARPEVRKHAHAMLAGKKPDGASSDRLFEEYYAPLLEATVDDPSPRPHVRIVK